jgi:hypothetical protein
LPQQPGPQNKTQRQTSDAGCGRLAISVTRDLLKLNRLALHQHGEIAVALDLGVVREEISRAIIGGNKTESPEVEDGTGQNKLLKISLLPESRGEIKRVRLRHQSLNPYFLTSNHLTVPFMAANVAGAAWKLRALWARMALRAVKLANMMTHSDGDRKREGESGVRGMVGAEVMYGTRVWCWGWVGAMPCTVLMCFSDFFNMDPVKSNFGLAT